MIYNSHLFFGYDNPTYTHGRVTYGLISGSRSGHWWGKPLITSLFFGPSSYKPLCRLKRVRRRHNLSTKVYRKFSIFSHPYDLSTFFFVPFFALLDGSKVAAEWATRVLSGWDGLRSRKSNTIVKSRSNQENNLRNGRMLDWVLERDHELLFFKGPRAGVYRNDNYFSN